MSDLRICRRCGWVHFGMARDACLQAVDDFNRYYCKLTRQKRDEYYGGSGATIDDYLRCHFCGADYTEMRDYQPGVDKDITGCTLQPIMTEGVTDESRED